jgi:hypothetical protein
VEVLLKECGAQISITHQYIESEGTSWPNTDLYTSDSLHKVVLSWTSTEKLIKRKERRAAVADKEVYEEEHSIKTHICIFVCAPPSVVFITFRFPLEYIGKAMRTYWNT